MQLKDKLQASSLIRFSTFPTEHAMHYCLSGTSLILVHQFPVSTRTWPRCSPLTEEVGNVKLQHWSKMAGLPERRDHGDINRLFRFHLGLLFMPVPIVGCSNICSVPPRWPPFTARSWWSKWGHYHGHYVTTIHVTGEGHVTCVRLLLTLLLNFLCFLLLMPPLFPVCWYIVGSEISPIPSLVYLSIVFRLA